MCGIAGAVGFERDAALPAVVRACRSMWARGPDDGGIEEKGAAVLGARRLAIIDPSLAGHQPMRDPGRGLTLVFNGMIYNFRDLRRRLEAEGERFSSRSDTEVLLRAYGRWGASCIGRLEGMFAFAIWDDVGGELVLARDPMGIKPLYYRHDGRRLIFASTVRALLATGLVPRTLSREGISSFLAYGAVSEPLTAIDGVCSVPAGHTVVFHDGDVHIEPSAPEGVKELEPLSEAEAAAAVRTALEETVRSHLVSDAPIGVFLSGGLDSSVVAALAARETPHVRTVSVTFDDRELSEESHQRRVAEHVRSDHVVISLRAGVLRTWLADAFAAMDQPTFDGINTYVVSRAAAGSGLKVALSGLGADELFDGYRQLPRVIALERARRLPRPVAAAVGAAAGRVGRGAQAAKIADWFAGDYPRGAAYELLRRLFAPSEVAQLVPSSLDGVSRPERLHDRADVAHQLAWLDLSNYTRNVLLRDTDAMSMANSLEVRVPFLHRPFVERVLAITPRLRTAPAKGLLVAAARDLLPVEILERRKHGFVLPLGDWMRQDLRSEIEGTLQTMPDALREILDPNRAFAVWKDFLEHGARWQRSWSLYALARWVWSVEAE